MELIPGYKHSDVGVIPEDWSVQSLGEIATIKDGTHQTPKYQACGVPFYSVEHVTSGDFENTKFISEQEHQLLTRSFRIEKGDILMTRIGSIGECKLINWDVRASFYVSLALLKIKHASAEYIAQYSNSSAFKMEIELHSLQHATPKKINLGPISDVKIALPQTETEQRAIAQALSDVDLLLAILDQVIAKKRELKQATMQQLLTGEKRLPGFSGDWEIMLFGDLFHFSGGFSASRDQLSNEGHCYLHYGDIHGMSKTCVNTRLDFLDIPKLDISLGRISEGSMLKHGDVVFVDASEDDAGTSKHVVIENENDVPFISGLHTIVAKSKTNDLAHAYKHYCFQTTQIRQQFMFYAVGTKVSGISKTNISKLTLPIPSIPEQIAIAAVLTSMDVELATLDARRDKTRNIKKAMMQELLTGKTRLV